MERSFLDLEARSTAVTAVLPAEDGSITVRLNELAGEDDPVRLRFAEAVASAVTTDLLGRELPSDVHAEGREVSLTVKRNSIAQLKIKLK